MDRGGKELVGERLQAGTSAVSDRWLNLVFFFQAEDGIRDLTVTGVQTCALPISKANALIGAVTSVATSAGAASRARRGARAKARPAQTTAPTPATGSHAPTDCRARSEERRVGKESRSRWSPYH